jgi:hypothetical protein
MRWERLNGTWQTAPRNHEIRTYEGFAAKRGIVLPAVMFHDRRKGWRNTGYLMKIGNIDTTAWTDEERDSFRVTLVELRDKIDSFLLPSSALA